MEKQYTYSEVKNILFEFMDYFDIQYNKKYLERFEGRLNNKGMNGNNGANEDKQEYFNNDLVESFID